MKAIVNVSKTSAYAKYNGLTFEVKEILPISPIIALGIVNESGITIVTDFHFKEVFIVDIQEEISSLKRNVGVYERLQTAKKEWGHMISPLEKRIERLTHYCSYKNIQI